jgi:hypothetical protein
MNTPNFLIIGAARSGTTSLYRLLNEHPDVFMSTPKEPLFFEAEYEKGTGYYWSTYFEGWSGQRAVGEARVAHLLLPYVPPRIWETVPDAKLVAILREPGERASSHWWLRRCAGLERRTFTAALRQELADLRDGRRFGGPNGEREWKAHFDFAQRGSRSSTYLECGYYDEQLGRYLRFFDRRQLKVLWFEDLCRDPGTVVREVCEFLRIDASVGLPELGRHNASVPRSLFRLMRLSRAVGLTDRLPQRVRHGLRLAAARFGGAPAMEAATRRWLFEHYAPRVRALEAMLEVDLGHWSDPGSGRAIEAPRAVPIR